MTVRPPQKLRRCQLVFSQDYAPPSRCKLPPRFLVELTMGERSQTLWVCRHHADPKAYAGSGCTVKPATPTVDDLIASDEGEA